MLPVTENIQAAEMKLPCTDLQADLPFYTEKLGFQLHQIFPSDDPAVAVLCGYGLRLRLERGAKEAPGTLRLTCKEPNALLPAEAPLKSPSGTKIEIVETPPPVTLPPLPHYAFVVETFEENAAWKHGRAGMWYRDLMPNRLGGGLMASHIRIPQGGPVPDMVHYHTIGFQLIYCYKGWVRVVYEDQGPPFDLQAGDCVIQPPQIRHRVLEASENLEVIEIALPAAHRTTIDHELPLPTPHFKPHRIFGGQKFCRHEGAQGVWRSGRLAGFERQETGVCEATGGRASVQMLRPVGKPPEQTTSHTSELLFGFVIEGRMTLRGEDQNSYALRAGDAFAVPPRWKMVLCECSKDLELLEVSLPGNFETVVHGNENLV